MAGNYTNTKTHTLCMGGKELEDTSAKYGSFIGRCPEEVLGAIYDYGSNKKQ